MEEYLVITINSNSKNYNVRMQRKDDQYKLDLN